MVTHEITSYKQLEINTFRELPEIDVGMVTSSLGIIVLKSSGFKIIKTKNISNTKKRG